MRIGSLFSGIGGLDLGLEWAGVGSVVWQCEVDPACRSVLAEHWSSARIFHDVRDVNHDSGQVEVLCGGFPCQDISLAGKGAGIDGSRSGLWHEYSRIIGELRPKLVIVENVAALVARGLDRVLGDLAALGYDAIWFPLRASDVGAAHRRERLFIVAWKAIEKDESNLDDAAGKRRKKRRSQRKGWLWKSAFEFSGRSLANANGKRLEIWSSVTSDNQSKLSTIERNRKSLANANSMWQRQQKGSKRHIWRRSYNSCKAHEWPPGPNDVEGWSAYLDRHPTRAPIDHNRRLNPSFVEALMGFPEGWTHGKRHERLKMLGNAVVPQVAEVVGAVALEMLRQVEAI